MTVDIDAVIEEVACAIRNRKCILFLGAAVHAAPPAGTPFDDPADQLPPFGAASAATSRSIATSPAALQTRDRVCRLVGGGLGHAAWTPVVSAVAYRNSCA